MRVGRAEVGCSGGGESRGLKHGWDVSVGVKDVN